MHRHSRFEVFHAHPLVDSFHPLQTKLLGNARVEGAKGILILSVLQVENNPRANRRSFTRRSGPVHRVVHQVPAKGGRTSRQPLTPREIESKGPRVWRSFLPPCSHVRSGEVANHHLATFTTLDSPRLRSFGFKPEKRRGIPSRPRPCLPFATPECSGYSAFRETDLLRSYGVATYTKQSSFC